MNRIPGKTIASSSCEVTEHLKTVWEFWYPSGTGPPLSAKEFLILFVNVCVLCRTKTLLCKRHWCRSRRPCLYPIMGGNESGQSHVDIVPGSTADRLTALGPWVKTEIIIVNWLIAQFMEDWWLLNLSYDQCLTWWDRASLSVQNMTKIKHHANLLFNQALYDLFLLWKTKCDFL